MMAPRQPVDLGEGLVPAHLDEGPVPLDHRAAQPVRVLVELAQGRALGADEAVAEHVGPVAADAAHPLDPVGVAGDGDLQPAAGLAERAGPEGGPGPACRLGGGLGPGVGVDGGHGPMVPARRGLPPRPRRASVGSRGVRQLLPDAVASIDPLTAYAVDRPRPAGRPWVASLFVSTADGAAAVGGRSGPLGGDGDREVFRAVRAVADVVVVGAGTVRAERYGPVTAVEAAAGPGPSGARPATPAWWWSPPAWASTRTSGCSPRPTGRPRPRWSSTRPRRPSTPGAASRAVAELVEVDAGPGGGVATAALLAELDRRHVGVAVCEGGPTLNGQLVADDVVDEVCLTLDPMVVGGDAPRIAPAHGVPAAPRPWRGAHLLEHEGVLFWRLVRDRTPVLGRGRGVLGQLAQLVGEVVHAGEVLVDAGEPEVGDLVEVAQALEHGQADAGGLDVAPPAAQAVLHPGGQGVDLLGRSPAGSWPRPPRRPPPCRGRRPGAPRWS